MAHALRVSGGEREAGAAVPHRVVMMGVFEGPQHVCRWANEALIEGSGFDPTGMPAREAWPDEDLAQDRMDLAYRRGQSRTYHHPEAVLRVRPLWDEDQVWGVATAWAPRIALRRLEARPAAPRSDHLLAEHERAAR